MEFIETLERSPSFSETVCENQEVWKSTAVAYPEDDLEEEKKRKFDWFVCIRALVLVLLLILAAADGYWMYHIYRYGILRWKRNALIITTLLLICVGVLLFWLWKNQNIKKQLEELFFDS